MNGVHFRTGLEPAEERVLARIGSVPRWFTRGAREVTRLGDRAPVWVGVAAAAALCAIRDRRIQPAAALLGSLVVGVVGRAALAAALDRERPPERLWRMHWSGPSFPSRHTTMATIGAGLLADALAGHRAGSGRAAMVDRPAMVGALRCLPSGAVGLSRLVLGVHWPSDVLAGWAFGAAALAITRPLRRRAGVAP